MKTRMLDRLPEYERESKTFGETLKAASIEMEDFLILLDDVDAQHSLTTATWRLDNWEKILGIPYDSQKTYEERRDNIRAKLRGTGKVDKHLIKSVVDAFTNGGVDVICEYDKYHIKIRFNDIKGRPSNMADVNKRVIEIIPAHMSLEFIYAYLIWKEFNKYNKTWKEWNDLELTWFELERFIEN